MLKLRVNVGPEEAWSWTGTCFFMSLWTSVHCKEGFLLCSILISQSSWRLDPSVLLPPCPTTLCGSLLHSFGTRCLWALKVNIFAFFAQWSLDYSTFTRSNSGVDSSPSHEVLTLENPCLSLWLHSFACCIFNNGFNYSPRTVH